MVYINKVIHKRHVLYPTLLCGLVLVLVSLPFSADAQAKLQETRISIIFDLDGTEIDPNLSNNKQNLQDLTTLFGKLRNGSISTINKITIDSYASPEGGVKYNNKLTQDRNISIQKYIVDKYAISEDIIDVTYHGIAWGALRQLVDESAMEYKDQVISIIDNVPIETWGKSDPSSQYVSLIDSRNKHLMDLKYGNPYKYMQEHIFPKLRVGNVITVYYTTAEPLSDDMAVMNPPVQPLDTEDAIMLNYPDFASNLTSDSRAVFAIKTNLLAYIPVVLNLGIEFPIGDHVSIDLPVYYSPYTIADSYRFRTLSMQPEVRFWFTEALKGHFLGLHAMGGWYNLSLGSSSRYQDKDGDTPFYGGGISYGYALSFKKNSRWGLEFTAGFGYAYFDTDKFYNIENGEKFSNFQCDYWGVSKLGVNLIYKFIK